MSILLTWKKFDNFFLYLEYLLLEQREQVAWFKYERHQIVSKKSNLEAYTIRKRKKNERKKEAKRLEQWKTKKEDHLEQV